MNLSENSHKIFAEFFQICDLCETFEFPEIHVYARKGSQIFTSILNVEGITFGRHIFVQPKYVWRDEKSHLQIRRKLIAHELVHVLQYQRLGFTKFLFNYVRDFWRIFRKQDKWSLKSWFESYQEIPYEIEARKFADDFMIWFENRANK